MNRVVSLEHPLAGDLIAGLRSKDTGKVEFRSLCDRLSYVLAVEATRFLSVKSVEVQTPLELAKGVRVDSPVVVVPILRAGLGMLSAFLEIIPDASVGYIGMERDEETAEAGEYYCKIPELEGAKVLVIDPMLATGGSACGALRVLREKGAADCVLVTVISAPEGIEEVHSAFPDVPIVTGVVDRCLDERRYIRPGLGDFGDRLFGT